MFDILFLVFPIITLLPLLIYSLYVIFGFIFHKNQDNMSIEKNISEKVTVLIPTFNEEKVIVAKISSILNALTPYFNNWSILVVDESTDHTVERIKELNNENIIIINSKERQGYNSAMHRGIRSAIELDTDYIVFTDSHSLINEDSLIKGVNYLKVNQTVGCVSGVHKINKDGQNEKIYTKVQNILRLGENFWDSNIFVAGELSIFRAESLSNVNDKMVSKTVFDIGCGILARKNLKKVKFLPAMQFEENLPPNNTVFLQQKRIRAMNFAKTLLFFRGNTFNYKLGSYGLITYPFFLYAIFLLPIFFPLSVVSMSLYFIPNIMHIDFFILVLLTIVSGTILYYLRSVLRTVILIEYILLSNFFTIWGNNNKRTDFVDKIDILR